MIGQIKTIFKANKAQIIYSNTPGTRVGSGFRDRTLAVKSRKTNFSFAFTRSGSKAIDVVRKREERKKERKKEKMYVLTMDSYSCEKYQWWRTETK